MTAPSSSSSFLDDPNNQSYTSIIDYYLGQWGLSSLTSLVDNLGRSGASNDQINLQLQQSDAWKQRFAGNAERVKNGLAALSPAEYIAMEGQYKQIMRSAGLPQGFYDDKSSLDSFIGKDVSASEMADRVKMATDLWTTGPQSARDAWNQYYGDHGTGGGIAAFLDPSVAEPLLQQQSTAAGIGGAALQQGLQLTNQSTAMQAAAQGVTIDTARKAYQDIASRMGVDTATSARFASPSNPQGFGQAQEEQATLLGNADAQKQQQTLYAEEGAQFSGHGAATDASGNPGSNY